VPGYRDAASIWQEDRSQAQGLEANSPKVSVPRAGLAPHATALLLAVFDFRWHQHG
jgi:hypothetical protein